MLPHLQLVVELLLTVGYRQLWGCYRGCYGGIIGWLWGRYGADLHLGWADVPPMELVIELQLIVSHGQL